MGIEEISSELIFENSFFKGLKYIVEIISLLTAPVILYLAYRGLEQIKLAKKESKLNSKREAYKITAEQCKDYQGRIIALHNQLFNKETEEKAKFLKESKVTITDKNISVEFVKDDTEKISTELLEVVNAMEGFSLFFVSGLGNERVAYETIGETFVDSTKYLLPFLIAYGNKKRFKNTMSLFIIWYKRREKDELEIEKKVLEDKLKTKKTVEIKHLQ